MIDYSEALNEWAEELGAVHLPRWDELPTLSLYMDQVLLYINETLSFLNVEPQQALESNAHKRGEQLLTAAMINNYVKQRFVPKPEKKRYQREHIACLIAYVVLKPVLPLTDIQKGIYLQLALCDRDFQKAYDIFCRQVEESLQCVSDLAQGKISDRAVYSEMPLSILGTSMSALSLATKLIAQKVLSLNTAEDGENFDLGKYMQSER